MLPSYYFHFLGLASVRAVVSQIATKSDIPPSTKSISTREQHLKISHGWYKNPQDFNLHVV